MNETDDVLAERLRRGDPRAFETLLDRFGPALLDVLAAITRDRALAEDLLQDTMLKVMHGIHGYRERASFRGWVFRVAIHTAHSALRRRRRRPEQPLDPHEMDLADPRAHDPLEALEREQQARRVALALDALPEEQRVVFLLRVRHELRLGEIARALGVPEGTVKSRLHHAVRKLQMLTQERCRGEIDERA